MKPILNELRYSGVGCFIYHDMTEKKCLNDFQDGLRKRTNSELLGKMICVPIDYVREFMNLVS